MCKVNKLIIRLTKMASGKLWEITSTVVVEPMILMLFDISTLDFKQPAMLKNKYDICYCFYNSSNYMSLLITLVTSNCKHLTYSSLQTRFINYMLASNQVPSTLFVCVCDCVCVKTSYTVKHLPNIQLNFSYSEKKYSMNFPF